MRRSIAIWSAASSRCKAPPARSRTATCSSPTIRTKAACRTSPTWRSSRRCSPTARSSRSPARSPTRPTSAARCAGSTSANATEMYHEGLLLPPIKIWDAGKPLPEIERIILANSRQPVLMRGDIHAQIAVTQMGVARVKELCGRFGAATVTGAFAAILKGAADELRGAIAELPEGQSSAEGFLDSDGIVVDKPIKLAVTITIKDGIASFDFSASDPQARGPVNLRPVDGRGLRVLCADRQPRAEPAFQRRHARRGAAHVRAQDHRQCRSALPGLQLPEGQPQAGRRDARGAGALPSRARDRQFGLVVEPHHRLGEGPARASPAINTRSSARPMAAASATTARRPPRRI